MSRKNSDPQLNLIHILPSETEKSNGMPSHDNAQHLRIQVGDETPSVVLAIFQNMVQVIQRGFYRLRKMFVMGLSLCQRAGTGMVSGFVVGIRRLMTLLKKTGKYTGSVMIQSSKDAYQASRNFGHVLTRNRKRPNRRTQALPRSINQESMEHSAKLERDELLWEVHALRDQLTAQRNELSRVNVQIGELKALALSQQQVLLHLGQELESIESKTVRSEKTAPKKVKPRSTRTTKSKTLPSSSTSSTEASMSLNPRR